MRVSKIRIFWISFNHKFTCQKTYRHCNQCLYMSQNLYWKRFQKNETIKQAFFAWSKTSPIQAVWFSGTKNLGLKMHFFYILSIKSVGDTTYERHHLRHHLRKRHVRNVKITASSCSFNWYSSYHIALCGMVRAPNPKDGFGCVYHCERYQVTFYTIGFRCVIYHVFWANYGNWITITESIR